MRTPNLKTGMKEPAMNSDSSAVGEVIRVQKVFDWKKAALLIKQNSPKEAKAGLSLLWNETSGVIYTKQSGIIRKANEDLYLASKWDTPVLELDGSRYDCFIVSVNTDWNAKTYWPLEARKLLYE